MASIRPFRSPPQRRTARRNTQRFRTARGPSGGAITLSGTLLRGAPLILIFAVIAGWNLHRGAPGGASALADLTGLARVVDGDTIDVKGMRVRLSGIDAPESDQTCARDGMREACGRAAGAFLAAMIGQDPVRCELSGKDVYGRYLGICWRGEVDLNKTMVWSGNAVAYVQYSYRYLPDEISARLGGRGLWATEFTRPDVWRRS